MVVRVLLAAALLLLASVACVAQDGWSLMEVGARAQISTSAAEPLQSIARLLVDASQSIGRMQRARQPYNVVANHIKLRRHTTLRLPPQTLPVDPRVNPRVEHVNADLVEPLRQPSVEHRSVFGTRHELKGEEGREYVHAEIVGEDGQPYAPRKQWEGISDEPATFRSPFARFIHPPAVGSSADVVNTDPNTKLTPVELSTVNSLQLRLRRVLAQLGANLVWDHTKVANRRLVAEFDAIREEAKALLEEYELRTGVKTIAWQLQENDISGVTTPRGGVTDIHFGKQPELASRPLQRNDSRIAPPVMGEADLAALRAAHGVDDKNVTLVAKPKQQVVDVAWKAGADGVVKAKVNLRVIDSAVPDPTKPANLATRKPMAGRKHRSGRVGQPSLPVNIDVVAPPNEQLARSQGTAQQPKEEKPTKKFDQPKINL